MSNDQQPHAYGVETLWSRGGRNERWGMAMAMSDYRQPLDRADAEELLARLVNEGHAEDGVRLVGLVAVDPTPASPADTTGGER